MKNKNLLLFIISLLCIMGCQRSCDDAIHPRLQAVVPDRYIKQLCYPFCPLTCDESCQTWGQEFLIGLSFAKDLDLYRAITAFKRALVLIPQEKQGRIQEIEYDILFCYYLGKKYQEVINTFEDSQLSSVNTDFPAFQDLLTILYDTYSQLDETEKKDRILDLIRQFYPETYKNLIVSSAISQVNFPALECYSQMPQFQPYLSQLVDTYQANKKSPTTAKWLNAIIPGTGYMYLGQRQTGVTALLVNGLFIYAAVHFFQKGEIAAGTIFASFEAGWYFGGIHGAAKEAHFYNERLYESLAHPLMQQKKLYPTLMLNYAF